MVSPIRCGILLTLSFPEALMDGPAVRTGHRAYQAEGTAPTARETQIYSPLVACPGDFDSGCI